MRTPLLCALSAALLLAGGCSRDTPPAPADGQAAAPATTATTATPVASQKVFSVEELAQMLAPVALYPDPLLAQVLMGSTYPGDVADAAAWSKANPDATGDAAVAQVATQPWDPSVQALVAFPQALAMMGQDPAWVQRLGDAFLAQPEDVMDGVQTLRHQARAAGNLASNEYQAVSTRPAPAPAADTVIVESAPPEVIVIESSQPDVIYVPSYDPGYAYGAWAYPSYPPVYYPPPAYYYPGGALARGLLWGTGVAIAGGLWGDMDWNDNDIDIDIDRYNNINVNNRWEGGDRNWNHNSINRDGVPYRDQANRDRNGRQLDGASTREAFRGDDAGRAQARDQARASMSDRGIAPATSNLDARDQARSAAQQRPEMTDRSRDAARDRAATQDRQRDSDRQRQQSQSNLASRDSARQQSQSRQSSSRSNAFEGASRPSQSRQSQSRGSSSRSSASHSSSRQSSGRSSGNQVSRSSRGGGRGR